MLSTPEASEICSPSAVNISGTPASRPPATSDVRNVCVKIEATGSAITWAS